MLPSKMKHSSERPLYPRALTEKERSITRWLVEHANIGEEERRKYLTQLDAATVVGGCACGCASIDFAIGGVASQSAPLDAFGDFIAKDRSVGVFVFAKDSNLAGVEIYSLGGDETPFEFPRPEQLELIEWTEGGQ